MLRIGNVIAVHPKLLPNIFSGSVQVESEGFALDFGVLS